MTSQPDGLGAQDLRALVREVLLEALPDVRSSQTPERTDESAGEQTEQWVVVDSDDALGDLVRDVARQCQDATRREELADGRVRYRLVAAPAADAAPERLVLRVERGAITERHVQEAGRTGATIVAAKGVVLTPLARDRARSTGIDIEREH